MWVRAGVVGVSLVVYLAAGLFGLSAFVLFLRPRAAVRNPLTVSTCVSIVLGALVFVAWGIRSLRVRRSLRTRRLPAHDAA